MGPWLDALSFLTWLGALTNSALVYLFSPESEGVVDSSGVVSSTLDGGGGDEVTTYIVMKELLFKTVFVAVVASHGYILVRAVVRHIVEKIWWKGSLEIQEREKEERTMKEKFLDSISHADTKSRHHLSKEPVQLPPEVAVEEETRGEIGFWDHDEGVDEIQRLVKGA